ncbi:MAG: cationic peptide transport system permease protein [Psychromonas sp.]|jgi:cationic peptide transport system permease protein|uniref:ABC transporter permease subunit n=1 Tax=Psychromonas sp. TaxID=1884585 RepID=UPI0039E5E492
MLNYLFRRLNLLLMTALILSIIAFTISLWSSQDPPVQHINLFMLYLDYMGNILQGQWGVSLINNKSHLLNGLIAFSSTLELCLVALLASVIIGIPLGVLAGIYRNGIIDYAIMSIALIGLALPAFWLAIMLIMLPITVDLGLPIDGNISPIYEIPMVTGFQLIDSLLASDLYNLSAFVDRLTHLILPSVVLSFFLTSEIIRLTRHSITQVMKSNYIKAANAKGLTVIEIIFRHVLQNALPPIIPQLRLQLNTIISLAMTVEIVFAAQGSGVWLLTSIRGGDYLALSAAVIIISGFILLSSIAIDILQMVISPTTRKMLYADK